MDGSFVSSASACVDFFHRAVVHALPFVVNRRGGDVLGGHPLDARRLRSARRSPVRCMPALGVDADRLEAVGPGLVVRLERCTARQVAGEPVAQRLGQRSAGPRPSARRRRWRTPICTACPADRGLRRAGLGRPWTATAPAAEVTAAAQTAIATIVRVARASFGGVAPAARAARRWRSGRRDRRRSRPRRRPAPLSSARRRDRRSRRASP